jgi:hypothetical protein
MNKPEKITNTRCSICTGKQGDREKINELLAKHLSHVEIYKITSVPARTISNHALHVGDIIEAAKKENILVQAVDVHAEFTEQLEFAKKLRQAAKNWLTDPNDPEGFTLLPRSDEVEIIYLDRNVLDDDGNPARRREPLQTLIDRMSDKGFQPVQIITKHADLRDISLKTLDRCDTAIDKFAKLAALYPKPQDTELLERIALLEAMFAAKK